MKNKTDNYPIIWKKETCLVGQCKAMCTKHWWSIPFTAPQGLTCECFHCKKTRLVKVEHEI